MLHPVLDAVLAAGKNQVVGGGLVLMLTGALMALFRKVPSQIGQMIRRQIFVNVDVLDRDAPFEWLRIWFDKHPYTKRARDLSAGVRYKGEEPYLVFSPAPGIHVLWYKGRPVWLSRSRETNTTSGNVLEHFSLRTFGRSPEVLRDLLEDARRVAKRPGNEIGIYSSQHDFWHEVGAITPRPLATVFLPPGMIDTIEGDIREFRDSEAWYRDRGIPWRRGYIFHGKPGTGKSSLVSALAGALGFDLYVLNLASGGLSDEKLINLLLNIPTGGALLLEDIDAVVNGREVNQKGPSTVTFKGLLNALDGVASKPGLMVFMTTNHIEKLDPALVRPGRADVKIEFPTATVEMIESFFLHFYGEETDPRLAREFADEFVQRHPTMAEVQAILLEYKTAPEGAVGAVTQ